MMWWPPALHGPGPPRSCHLTVQTVTRPVRPVLPSPPLQLAPCSGRSQRWLGAGLGSILGTHRSSVEVLAGPGKFDRHPSNNTKWKNFGKNESIWFLVTSVRQCHTIPTNYLLCQYLWTSAKGCIRGEHKVKKEGFKRLGQSPGCKKIKHLKKKEVVSTFIQWILKQISVCLALRKC